MQELVEFSRHGGALDVARRRFPDAPEPWLDLSTGINPICYPLGMVATGAWTRLPEAADLDRLERMAAARYGAPATAETVAAPGTQAIIQRLPALLGGMDIRILGRTYSEFGRVFRETGGRVREVPMAGALAGADVAIVVNPNNPDGRLVSVGDLLGLAGRVGTLVVDEAFGDTLPVSASLVPCLPPSRVTVLRSFGKMYGLAGLRLGFAIGASDLMDGLRRMLGPWPVSGPAIAAGLRALGDGDWLAETRSRLRSDSARLSFLLGRTGATTIGGTPLFRLVSHTVAPRLFETLAERGILARTFSDEPTWLRFGLPGTEPDWQRFEVALSAF